MRSSRPAPMTSITASATSAVTSTRRRRWPRAAALPRFPSRGLPGALVPVCTIGANPKSRPAAIETAAAKSRTGTLMATSCRARQAGRDRANTSARTPKCASQRPSSASRDRQQHALGHRLPEQPATAGAERRHGRRTRGGATRLGPAQVREVRAARSAGRGRRRLAAPRSRDWRCRRLRPAAVPAASEWSCGRAESLAGTCPFAPVRSPQFSRNAFSSVRAASGVTPSFSRPMT